MKTTRTVTRGRDGRFRYRKIKDWVLSGIAIPLGIFGYSKAKFRITIHIHSGGEFILKRNTHRGDRYDLYRNGERLAYVCVDKTKTVFGQCHLNRRFDIKVVKV